MAVLGTVALIALVILGVMVLRVKSDPLDKQSIRDALAEAKRTTGEVSHQPPQDSNSNSPPPANGSTPL